MANSVVKVTESAVTDSLILVVGEDGTVTPDKETVQAYLNSRSGETELQIMHVNKSDGKGIDVTVESLTYVASHEEKEMAQARIPDLDEISRNLNSFRMDHDYTPLTSPRQHQSRSPETGLTATLVPFEAIARPVPTPAVTTAKIIKTVPKTVKKLAIVPQTQKTLNLLQMKEKMKAVLRHPLKVKKKEEEEDKEDHLSDEDFTIESDEDDGDDLNDSDFDLQEETKKLKKRRTRTRSQQEDTKKKVVKAAPVAAKLVVESPKIEKVPEKIPEKPEEKLPEKKPTPKKEKKVPKPIPNDFALFSTPDIIRRVGKDGSSVTPTTPTAPETLKQAKPAKIFPDSPKIQRMSLDSKRLSIEKKEKDKVKVSSPSDNKNKDRRHSMVDGQSGRKSIDAGLDGKVHSDKKESENLVTVQSLDESGGNSNESEADNNLEPMPSAEDIRAIIQNEDTKTFTSSLVIPESADQPTESQPSDQNQMSLDTPALDLDQSILDNINSELISEDILYQVAQSLVDNAELQNVIDKSIVEGNLVLDPALQQNVEQEQNLMVQQQQHHQLQSPANTVRQETGQPSSAAKGTQIVRPGGRVVVIPPIERPTTRSRNRRSAPEETKIKTTKVLDEGHTSGAELDSSSDDDKSDDDPDKLWCICNQPHNNRFMICCDTCEEWYHGKCVNVTKAMGQLMEEEGREWICVYCKDPSLKRPAAAARRIRKASRTSSTETPIPDKKPEIVHQSPPAKTPSATVPSCLVCGKPSRTNSIYCSDPCILKHAKVVEKVVVFDRSSGKLFSGNNAPSTANLDKWLQQNPGFEVVRSANANRPLTTKALKQTNLKIVKNTGQAGVSLAVQARGVNVGVLKHAPRPGQGQNQRKIIPKQGIPGLKIISKQPGIVPKVKLIHPPPLLKSPVTPKAKQPPVPTPKLVKVTPPPKERPMPQKTPKSRQAEETAPQPKKEENIRDNVQKTLFEQLINRLKVAEDIKVSKEEVNKISAEIELQLYKCFGDTGQKYRNKYRSLIFNIKDVKNQTLWRKICEKAIGPYQLVRLSPDDMASQELAMWRERENKHQLEMITKTELEQLGRNRQLVFKTHKGEQEVEVARPADALDSTEVIMGLGPDSSASPQSSDNKKDSKTKDKKGNKHSKDRDKQDRKASKERDKDVKKDKKKDSRDRSRRKRSRSKEKDTKLDRNRSRSRDRDRHRRSSHKNSRHKKEMVSTTEKLDKKSKEILEQLVDNKIVPPLEDRLWKHVQQEDITSAPAESDSDHEPSSTVTIPTPPHSAEVEERQTTPIPPSEGSPEDTKDEIPTIKAISPNLDICMDEDGSQSPPPRKKGDFIWKGTINMVDVAEISITAHEVSGDCIGLGEELPPCLDVVGRILPDTVWEYIGKMRCSNSKTISLLRLNATDVEEKMPYIALYSYLSSRNRLGVVKSSNKAVKDFYILPLAPQKPIPQALLPISGPGFEEQRPALLLGIIVRDKRKRPIFTNSPVPTAKRTKLDVPALPLTPTIPSGRSYTPPPIPETKSKTVPSELPKEEAEDMDEPYSPGDSDPEPAPVSTDLKSTHLNSSDITNLLSGSIKSSSFLETGITTQTFQPFSNKFDAIPGLDESGTIPANSEELKRKMEELDERIAKQKAEIDNMSQNIASSTNSDLGQSALASIALPSNLQQILDSIKGINATATSSDGEATQKPNPETKGPVTSETDLTIPLLLPKIGTRAPSLTSAIPTIPLNLPKFKPKAGTSSPKTESVLSSLSEDDLIRKANEMLAEGEHESYKPSFSEQLFNIPTPSLPGPPSKSAKLDVSQPPIPGLNEEL